MKTIQILLFTTIFLQSCGVNRFPIPPSAAYPVAPTDRENLITQSLFEDKTATISEENIQKILDGTYQLPERLRVAIIKLDGRKSYLWNDEDYLKTEQSYIDTLTKGAQKSGRITSIHSIPQLLLSANPTFTNIREAGVRMQADVILIFSTTGDLYRNYKFLSKTDLEAFATTQLLALDVRTGLIPFSTIVTKDFVSQKQETELNTEEAQQRVQNQAVLLTLNEIVIQTNVFLKAK